MLYLLDESVIASGLLVQLAENFFSRALLLAKRLVINLPNHAVTFHDNVFGVNPSATHIPERILTDEFLTADFLRRGALSLTLDDDDQDPDFLALGNQFSAGLDIFNGQPLSKPIEDASRKRSKQLGFL